MKVKVVLDLAKNYSVNSEVFRENENYVKEYGNLCSATALYLLALQNEELNKDQTQELVKKCEGLIKLQEEMEKTLFSNKRLVMSTKINSKYENNVIQNQSLDSKDTHQNVEQTYCSETDSDDSNSDLDFKGRTFEEYELFREQKNKVGISKQPAFITDYQIVPVPSFDNDSLQEQNSLGMPVKKLKLEVLSKFSVTNNVKDQNEFSLAYAEEKVAKPEIKYFNFSLEQMKSFSQRFQGKIYDSNQKIISSMSGNDLELTARFSNKFFPNKNNGIYSNCKDFLCPYETRIRECYPTELHAKLRAKALDPYGFMILKNHGRYRPYDSKCQNENCHATLR